MLFFFCCFFYLQAASLGIDELTGVMWKTRTRAGKEEREDSGEMVSLFVIPQNSLTQKQLGDGINHFAHGGVPLIICV